MRPLVVLQRSLAWAFRFERTIITMKASAIRRKGMATRAKIAMLMVLFRDSIAAPYDFNVPLTRIIRSKSRLRLLPSLTINIMFLQLRRNNAQVELEAAFDQRALRK